MKSIKPVWAVVLFIAALAVFAVSSWVGASPADPPGRHEQPPTAPELTPTTAADIHALGCLETKAQAIEVEAIVVAQGADQTGLASSATAVEPTPQRRFGTRARWFPNCGWEYGWQRSGT